MKIVEHPHLAYETMESPSPKEDQLLEPTLQVDLHKGRLEGRIDSTKHREI
jgi:hypothetical protein